MRAWDHPRSRGVYWNSIEQGWYSLGSSPLARGLPQEGAAFHSGEGIIPARAGFTHLVDLPPRAAQDHPRSRGVYSTTYEDLSQIGGSSPLARGLRH